MSRRQRSVREQAQRARLAREKSLRRRARSRRAVTAAAAVTLTGAGSAFAPPVATAVPGTAQTSAPDCSGVSTPGSSASNLTDVDGTLFFTASDALRGEGLWRTDGTAAGTVRLKDLGESDDYYDYSHTSLVGVGGTLYFTADGDRGEELWRSDGTRAGTVLVKRFPSGGGDDYGDGGLDELTAVGNTLFFTADDGSHGQELWRSNGTRSGTVMVKDIQPPSGHDDYDEYSYGPLNLTAMGNQLFFTANDGDHGQELWRSDGTEAGTVLVKDIRPGSYSSASYGLAAAGDLLFFRARDGAHGRELWRSDGTEAGTVLVKDIRPGSTSSSPDEIVAVGDAVFFGVDAGEGRDLWRSDGTEAGTVLVKAFPGGDEDYYGVSDLTAVGDTLFFGADDGTHGQELWSSDGTEAGTVLVKNIRAGDYAAYPRSLTAVGGTLFFTARDGVHGMELWRSDGTEAGTTLVEDISPGVGDRPRSLTESGGVLFFTADDWVHGDEVWSSDGTADGTALVKDVNSGGELYVPSRGTANLDTGTLRIRVEVDTAGTVDVRPVGDRLIKGVVRDAADAGTVPVLLEPTRAAKRELRRTGRLRVKARYTFTTCGGGVDSVVREHTLRMGG